MNLPEHLTALGRDGRWFVVRLRPPLCVVQISSDEFPVQNEPAGGCAHPTIHNSKPETQNSEVAWLTRRPEDPAEAARIVQACYKVFVDEALAVRIAAGSPPADKAAN